MSFIRVISIAYLLFVLGSACQAAENPGEARLAGFRNTARLSPFGGNEGKAMLVGGAVAAAVLGLFGYFYGREWYLNRRLRSYKVGTASNAILQRRGQIKLVESRWSIAVQSHPRARRIFQECVTRAPGGRLGKTSGHRSRAMPRHGQVWRRRQVLDMGR